MSSIRELFGDDALDEGSEEPFDLTTLGSTLDQILKDRPVPGAPIGFVSKGAPLAPMVEPLEPPVVPEGSPPAPIAAEIPPAPAPLQPPTQLPDPGLGSPQPPPAPLDPFSGLTDLERQELLAVRQAMQDPDRALAVKRAYLGVPEAPPVAAAPPTPPAPKPTLPEDVDPDSFEAKLWQQNQDLMERIDRLTVHQTEQSEQTQAQLNMTAAKNATQAFGRRYGDRLSPEEIMAVAQSAGAQKLPDAFLATTNGDIEAAMEKSLEFVLRSNDVLLAKVLGAPAPPPQNQLPSGNDAESIARKRSLTALSSAASPTGEVTQRQPLQHRGDGRLTETSKQSLIHQMMNGMNADEGTN